MAAVVLGVLLASLAACTGEEAAGRGDLAVSVAGGAAVRDGFPHTDGEATFAFADGWELQFTKYVVSVGNVRLTEPGSGDEVASWAGPTALDLKQDPSASLELTVLGDVPAIRQDIWFDVLAVSSATDPGNVAADDFDLMSQNGWSILAEGTATNPSQGTVRFRFGLPIASRYSKCINGKDQTQGVAVEANKTTGVFIYAHAIHLFWDTLATGDEDLRFDAFAAVKGDDDLVTEEELRGQDLNDLRDGEGNPLRDNAGKRVFYNDNGKLPPGQQTLYHFVIEAAKASAHFNGVGLCTQQPLDG
jgi:hypothetical protein